MIDLEGPVLVTGTDTGVGKTVVTAALASLLLSRGNSVEVIKIAQTGDENDAAEITRLCGVRARALTAYPDPLAPFSAARRSGLPLLELEDVVEAASDVQSDVVLLEGAGGLLVQLGAGGWTARDLASELGCPAVVVARAGLGTLNHTALTLEALTRRVIEAAVVIGAWPAEPGLAELENLKDLPGPRLGRIPEGAAALEPEEFRRRAPGWFDLSESPDSVLDQVTGEASLLITSSGTALRMKKLMALTLGVFSAIGGFVDLGDIVASGVVGARYGLGLTWAVVLGVIGICVFAEMSGRIAAVSGTPVYGLIRDKLGPGAALVNLIASFAVTLLSLTAQIGGIALVISLASHIPHIVWVIPVGIGLWLVIWRVKFDNMERAFGLSGLTIAVFAVALWWLDPDWGALGQQVASVAPPAGEPLPTYLFYAIVLFAAAMTPYAVFFFSSGGVEEGWKPSDLRTQRLNVMLGFPLGGLLSVGIAAAAATVLLPKGVDVKTLDQVVQPAILAFGAAGLAVALFGFFAATVGAALECGLSCGYAMAQYFGWPWGKRVAPKRGARFHLTVGLCLLVGVLVVQTGVDPIQVTEYSLVFTAVALPLTYLPVLVAANDPDYAGEHVNGRLSNGLGIAVLAVIVIAAAAAIPLMILTRMGA
ncbi:MAG TPA: dethiobiotin synthase [Glycomyces sp.]|nr:dethiobiotin synthase [Glycomyces sp.]